MPPTDEHLDHTVWTVDPDALEPGAHLARVLRWWHEEGGTAVTFGSDAHEPAELARRFTEAVDIAEAHGFRPGRDPVDPWSRVR